MFKFLKEKLSSVVKKFSKDVEEEAELIEKKEEIKEIKEELREVTLDKKAEQKQKPAEKKEIKLEKKDKETPKEKQKEIKLEKKEIKKEPREEKQKPREDKKSEKKAELKQEVKGTEKETEEGQKEETKISEISEEPEEKQHHRGFFSKLFKKDKPIEEEKEKEVIEEAEEELEEESEVEAEEELGVEPEVLEDEDEEEKESEKKEISEEPEKSEKRGFFTKITETFTKINLSEDKFEELFWELEVMLLENNVAVEVIQKIKDDLKKELMSDKISRKNVDEIIKDSLKKSLEEILDIKGFDLEDKIKNKKPYIIAVIGVNGSGKTTTIAKLCYLLKKKGYSVVLAAADTFRAAAIQQLEHHAEKLDVKMIKHDYNSDPAAVAFDAIKHAEAKKIDVVVIDTAGRLHSNDNLMNELKKLIKVNKPDLKLFVGESITGNDCVEQAKVYDEIIGIDAIILSKADIDEKGGAALSISYVTKKPVLFVGTGQTYDDLKPFDKKEIMEGLGF